MTSNGICRLVPVLRHCRQWQKFLVGSRYMSRSLGVVVGVMAVGSAVTARPAGGYVSWDTSTEQESPRLQDPKPGEFIAEAIPADLQAQIDAAAQLPGTSENK